MAEVEHFHGNGNMKVLKQNEYEIIYEDINAKRIFSKTLQILAKLSIPFSVEEIKEESDAEDDSWRYTVIKIRINAREDFKQISDEIIDYAYSDIDPNDATRVLLMLENV